MAVQCFAQSADNFQPHSLPPRLPSGWGDAGRVQSLNRIVAPALSDGVAQPVDIPMGKLRKVNSRSSMEDVLASSRTSHSDTGPSSFGSSFGSSPYNMFGFTPPFASAGATPPVAVSGTPAMICGSSPPEAAVSVACPLVFGEAKNTTARIVPISAFTVFQDDAEASGMALADPYGEASANAYSVFIEQQQQEFCSEQLPFADPAGSEDHDSKIGSFVEECWHAPALQLFSDQNGKRASQSTKSLEEELLKLRDTKETIQRESAS